MKIIQTNLDSEGINSPLTHKKKNWMEPQISAWESDQIELAGLGGVDGGLQTSAQ